MDISGTFENLGEVALALREHAKLVNELAQTLETIKAVSKTSVPLACLLYSLNKSKIDKQLEGVEKLGQHLSKIGEVHQ